MRARTTSIVVASALLSWGSTVLVSAPALADSGSRHHWRGGHGRWHGGWHHHRHFGFYGGPIYVGGYSPSFGCYIVNKTVFIPGRGYAKRAYRVCDGSTFY
jgi:hypothetical protein